MRQFNKLIAQYADIKKNRLDKGVKYGELLDHEQEIVKKFRHMKEVRQENLEKWRRENPGIPQHERIRRLIQKAAYTFVNIGTSDEIILEELNKNRDPNYEKPLKAQSLRAWRRDYVTYWNSCVEIEMRQRKVKADREFSIITEQTFTEIRDGALDSAKAMRKILNNEELMQSAQGAKIVLEAASDLLDRSGYTVSKAKDNESDAHKKLLSEGADKFRPQLVAEVEKEPEPVPDAVFTEVQ
jgi:hypothetical protein